MSDDDKPIRRETMIVYNVADRPSFAEIRVRIKAKVQQKVEQALVAFVRWALSKRAVQNEIANAFEGVTPMCRILSEAVRHHVEMEIKDNEVDVDDVKGLDRYFEDAIESHFSDKQNLQAIVDGVKDEGLEEMTDTVVRDIIAKLER